MVAGLNERNPENKVLFRTAALKKTNVMKIFDNFKRALKSWDFIDETEGYRIVQSLNIFAQIGKTDWTSCLC